jgi:host factor-I protein
MVYKHAISTVVPSRNVRMGNGHEGHAEAHATSAEGED